LNTENIYYCYVYKREDGTPYYIGKGKGSRAFITSGRIINPPRDRTNIFFACEGVSETEAFEMEVALISLLGRKDIGTGILRNKTDGGEGVSGVVVSEETRQKMSRAKKGRPLTEETKRRISVTLTGRPMSEESRRKLIETRKNQPLSEESRRKMSESRKGKSPTEETRKRMSKTRKGSKNASKLTDVQRLEIVQRRKNGESILKLATEFGVTQRTIYNCCKPQF